MNLRFWACSLGCNCNRGLESTSLTSQHLLASFWKLSDAILCLQEECRLMRYAICVLFSAVHSHCGFPCILFAHTCCTPIPAALRSLQSFRCCWFQMVRGAVEALFNAVIAVPTHIVECNNPCHVISGENDVLILIHNRLLVTLWTDFAFHWECCGQCEVCWSLCDWCCVRIFKFDMMMKSDSKFAVFFHCPQFWSWIFETNKMSQISHVDSPLQLAADFPYQVWGCIMCPKYPHGIACTSTNTFTGFSIHAICLGLMCSGVVHISIFRSLMALYRFYSLFNQYQ